jgi:hypothetical protein
LIEVLLHAFGPNIQPVQHADETGWTEGKHRAWRGVVVTAQVAVFLLDRL